jgi:dihydroxyacetone kinase-like protein
MTIKNSESGTIVLDLIQMIHDNATYLSDIDGKIGDGDHGINMNKGFTLCKQRLSDQKYTLSEGLGVLSRTLMDDIGGSMGPLYGIFFEEMSLACEGLDEIGARDVETMLKNALSGIQEIGNAKRGDKTLLDTLIPGVEAYSAALESGKDFREALVALQSAAKRGWQSTEVMVAKVGRASRLGERSRGVLDAGATSCWLILNTMADSIKKRF